MKRKAVEGFCAKDIHTFPINVTFFTSSLQSLPRKDVGSSPVVRAAVAQPCPWARWGRASEKAASWDDRHRMKSRRAGSCDARSVWASFSLSGPK